MSTTKIRTWAAAAAAAAVLLTAGCGASTGTDAASQVPTPPGTSQPATPPNQPKSSVDSTDDPHEDQGWYLMQDVAAVDSPNGTAVTGTVTNMTGGTRTALLHLTISKNGQVVYETDGTATAVADLDSQKVTFIGTTEHLPAGPYTYELRVEGAY